MGKALIFSGITVSEPLEVINLRKPLVSASDYVTEFSKLATGIKETDKTNLTTFIQTLMSNNLWNKVVKFFPLVGGLNGVKFDIKDVYNQVDWSVMSATTWNEGKNSILTAVQANQTGKAISCAFDWNNGAVFVGGKPMDNKEIIYPRVFISSDSINPYYGDTVDNGLDIVPVGGGNGIPNIGTPRGYVRNTSWVFEDGNVGLNTRTAGGIYAFNFKSGENVADVYIKIYGGKSFYATASSFEGEQKSTDHLEAVIGNTAAGSNTYGTAQNVHFLLIFNTALSKEETKIVVDALEVLQEGLGRLVE